MMVCCVCGWLLQGTFTSKTIPVNMGPKDVLVEVEACGVCHTDFYTLSRPGVVPGHEVCVTRRAAPPHCDSMPHCCGPPDGWQGGGRW